MSLGTTKVACVLTISLALLSVPHTTFALQAEPAFGQAKKGRAQSPPPRRVRVEGTVKTDNQRDDFDRAVGISQLVVALVGLIGVPLLVWQVSNARREARGQRTSALAERYSSPEFFSVASRTVGFFEARNAGDCVGKIKAWSRRDDAQDACLPGNPRRPKAHKACARDVQQILSFFEDFAASYNRGDLIRRVAHDSFSAPSVQVFTKGWWYICWRRRGRRLRPRFGRRLRRRLGNSADETELYAEFERLTKSLRKRNRDLTREDFDLTPPARVLCLPPDALAASDEEWARSERLSLALSDLHEQLTRVVEAMEEAGCPPAEASTPSSGQPTPKWQILLIPPAYGVKKQRWTEDRKLAERLARCVSELDDGELDKAIDSAAPDPTQAPP